MSEGWMNDGMNDGSGIAFWIDHHPQLVALDFLRLADVYGLQVFDLDRFSIDLHVSDLILFRFFHRNFKGTLSLQGSSSWPYYAF